MNFSEALETMKQGQQVVRSGWNGKGMFISIALVEEGAFITQPYIYIFTVQGDRIPWLASQADLMAEDWQLA